MIDLFVILTPIFVLGIIALLGFIGCDQVLGLDPTHAAIEVVSVVPNSGTPAGGTEVTISGSGFETGSSVSFGGTLGTTVVVSSETTIFATTPPHASGFVDVSVIKSDGETGTQPSGFFFNNVVNLQTVAQRKAAGNTISVSLQDHGAGKLIVATVQWGGNATVTLSGGSFTQFGADNLNPQRVSTFYAMSAGGPVTVTATLSAPTTTDINLILSAYDNTSSVPDQPSSAQGTGTTASLNFQTATLSPGDGVYAIAVSRDNNSILTGALAPGTMPPFVPETGQGGYIMLQDYALMPLDVSGQFFIIGATITNGTAASKWYLFAMRIPHA